MVNLALKKCVNTMHGSRKELLSQVTGVESPRMALDTAQARLIEGMRRHPTALGACG